MVAILLADDPLLLNKALNGEIGIMEAGRLARDRIMFIKGFHALRTSGECVKAAEDVGVDEIWDNLIAPVLS
jgi:hypothetical protein